MSFRRNTEFFIWYFLLYIKLFFFCYFEMSLLEMLDENNMQIRSVT